MSTAIVIVMLLILVIMFLGSVLVMEHKEHIQKMRECEASKEWQEERTNEWREKYFGIEVENEKIVEAYDNLGKRYAFLQKEYDELRKRHADLENKFDAEIKEFRTDHDAKYIYLEAHHEQALEEIKKQMEKYADLQSRYDAVCDERDNLNESCERYENKIISLENAVRELTFKSEGTQVAYDAILSANQKLQDQLNKLHFTATSVQQQLDASVKERDRLAGEIEHIRGLCNKEGYISYRLFDMLALLGEAFQASKVTPEMMDNLVNQTNAELQA